MNELTNGLSAADVAAVTNGNGFGNFGGEGAWWLIVLFLFAFSNGRNGFFGGGDGGNGMQRGFDQQALVSNQNAILQQLNTNAMLLQQSGCDTRAGIADLKYTVATEACADRNAVSEALRDVLVSNSNNTQRILDQMCQDKIDAKNEEIANLRTQLNMAALAASQGAQTAQILADNARQTTALEQYLNPTPIPAYFVPNPNCCGNYGGCGCGQVA